MIQVVVAEMVFVVWFVVCSVVVVVVAAAAVAVDVVCLWFY